MPLSASPRRRSTAHAHGSQEVRSGDALLIRLRWGSETLYGSEAYLGVGTLSPGVDISGAQCLIDRGVRLTGTGTIAYEALAPGDPERAVHRMLLRKAGIYIVENLALDQLAQAAASELRSSPRRYVSSVQPAPESARSRSELARCTSQVGCYRPTPPQHPGWTTNTPCGALTPASLARA
jgi:hypothetical protein